MSVRHTRRSAFRLMAAGAAGLALPQFFSRAAQAAVPALKQSIAEAASKDEAIAAFYRSRNFKPIFTGSGDGRRRSALLKAFATAGDHGLPTKRYDGAELKDLFKASKTARDQGRVEVEAAKRFLAFADDIRSGVLDPRKVDSNLFLDVARFDRTSMLDAFSKSSPNGFMKKLAPNTNEYTRLQKQKLKLEKTLARGGWGEKVQSKSLKLGESGGGVVQLRNRLIRMGYMRRSASQTFDAQLQSAVQQFQSSHGLPADGVAGSATIGEANKPVETRLKSVLVAMERLRWNNRPLERDHVWVNIPDFHVNLVKNGKTTFRSRVVVGKDVSGRRTPEFSDQMEFMVINPTWYVPRSIVTKEYLPLLKRNPNAQAQLKITDSKGRAVNRSAVNFSQYNEKNFPYSMRQPPSKGNALGLVKFMFPNQHNIYLHDTPAKALFGKDLRAYSHGCVRVHEPFEFAYALLKAQEGDPEGFFNAKLSRGKEARVNLAKPLPVHLVYYTAWVDAKGNPNYRRDVYGRDQRIFDALSKAGVSLRSVQS
ncbi:MAG: L,D-transpeptidase family protein [Litoreibacter sp.]